MEENKPKTQEEAADPGIRTVEFGEELLGDPSALARLLFDDEKDPRSIHYKRQLVRPKIAWWRVLFWLLAPLLCIGGILFFFHFSEGAVPLPGQIALIAAFLLLYLFCTGKKAFLCAVRIYQRCAPAAMRMKCRFEPSCSQYMILSVEKYGLLKGVRRGIRRLRRCNIDGGGFDLP